jgi:hypothetical protein
LFAITVFKNIVAVPNYLDYFPKNAFQIQVKYITEYYLGENKETKENFIYLSQSEMNNFVVSATETILENKNFQFLLRPCGR